ncbi:helix-turn-helix domain-containing protein [Niveibacterium microcysteis]|uniref:Helix-turn-helix domain-containing protein n=1 Tax=Niveibacterium microcysteis TaxID=2811415 RepID=A0ABX7M3L2_9RHOO|nr:helix-turn-helix domain-containing protein [Niveibacterium microcysteis]QSI76347.1 helix-turn-helix domain-containing protein [Niveibacterium microcysteis]
MGQTAEKSAFAERLRLALGRSAKRISTPAELVRQFNLRYTGKPVSPQAVQKWLAGENRPTQDKIELLAKMLGVSSIWLQFGIEQGPNGTPQRIKDIAVKDATEEELRLIGRYRRLSAYQQELVSGLIEQLALSANTSSEA